MAALLEKTLSQKVIGAAIEVHRAIGPGLLESAYRECLVEQLQSLGLQVERERRIPVTFRGRTLECGYRADLIVEGAVLVELKAVERLLPIHEAQVLTYLKLSGIRVALIFNFHSARLVEGMRRLVA